MPFFLILTPNPQVNADRIREYLADCPREPTSPAQPNSCPPRPNCTVRSHCVPGPATFVHVIGARAFRPPPIAESATTGSSRGCRDCHGAAKFDRWQGKQVVTAVGAMTATRPAWTWPCGQKLRRAVRWSRRRFRRARFRLPATVTDDEWDDPADYFLRPARQRCRGSSMPSRTWPGRASGGGTARRFREWNTVWRRFDWWSWTGSGLGVRRSPRPRPRAGHPRQHRHPADPARGRAKNSGRDWRPGRAGPGRSRGGSGRRSTPW